MSNTGYYTCSLELLDAIQTVVAIKLDMAEVTLDTDPTWVAYLDNSLRAAEANVERIKVNSEIDF